MTETHATWHDPEMERDLKELGIYRDKRDRAAKMPVIGGLLAWYYDRRIARYETELNLLLAEHDR